VFSAVSENSICDTESASEAELAPGLEQTLTLLQSRLSWLVADEVLCLERTQAKIPHNHVARVHTHVHRQTGFKELPSASFVRSSPAQLLSSANGTLFCSTVNWNALASEFMVVAAFTDDSGMQPCVVVVPRSIVANPLSSRANEVQLDQLTLTASLEFLLTVQLQGDMIGLCLHTRHTELSAVEKAALQAVQAVLDAAAKLVNQMFLLEHMDNSKLCCPLLRPVLIFPPYPAAAWDANALKWGWGAGHLGVSPVFEHEFVLHWRLTPQRALQSVKKAMIHFNVHNLHEMLVYREQENNAVFLLQFQIAGGADEPSGESGAAAAPPNLGGNAPHGVFSPTARYA
jgi:hypothetical protein